MEDKQAWYQLNSCMRVSVLIAFSAVSYLFFHSALEAPLPLEDPDISKVGCQQDGYFCDNFELGPKNLYHTFITGVGSEFKGITVFFTFSPKDEVFASTDSFSLAVAGTFIVEQLENGMVDKILLYKNFSVDLNCSKKQSVCDCNSSKLTTLRSLEPEEYRISIQLRNNDLLLSKLHSLRLRSELESLESGRKLRTHRWMVFLVSVVFFFGVVVDRCRSRFGLGERFYHFAVVPLSVSVCGLNFPYFIETDETPGNKCPASLALLWSLILPMLAFTLTCFIVVEQIRSFIRKIHLQKRQKTWCTQDLFELDHLVASVMVLLLAVVWVSARRSPTHM